MKNMNKFISFILGAAVGSAVTFAFVSKKYQKMYENDVASVKESLGKTHNNVKVKEEEPVKADKVSSILEKNKITVKAAENIATEEGYTDYTQHMVKKNRPCPKVIPVQEFGADQDYKVITLYWTADDILVDEDGDMIKNIPETVGGNAIVAIKEIASSDAPDTDDCVYVINNEKETYYEILLTLQTYEEFRA